MEKIRDLDTLAILAHFDDAEWAIFGMLAQIARFNRVGLVILTNSNQHGIGDRRLNEQLNAMEVAGFDVLYPLGYPDGQLIDLYSVLVPSVIPIVEEFAKGQPIRIVSFGPEGLTSHKDHIAAGYVGGTIYDSKNEVKELWQVGMHPLERLLWMRDYGNRYMGGEIPMVDISRYQGFDVSATLHTKIKAIETHQSQYYGNGGKMHVSRLLHLPPIEYYRTFTK